jgi:hypothetical protein
MEGNELVFLTVMLRGKKREERRNKGRKGQGKEGERKEGARGKKEGRR